MFKSEAKVYDLFHDEEMYVEAYSRIKKQFPNLRTVLEIGSGSGRLTRYLEKKYEVTPIEPSEEMVRYHKANTYPINTTIQDFKKKKFDFIVASYDVLNYVPFDEIGSVLRKMTSMCKHFYVDVWNEDRVDLLRVKFRKGVFRIRIGFAFSRIAHLLFIYIGLCIPRIEYHKFYMHDSKYIKSKLFN